MFKLNKKIGSTNFSIFFEDKVNVIRGNSGTGKTFMFSTIASYCMLNSIKYAYIDYNFVASNDTDLIYQHCYDKDIIILDNADLYLDSELFSKLLSLNATIILSKKTTYGLDMKDAHLYVVNYDSDCLSTRRIS